nr:aminotransferase class I/II-fold pyridoxal phosphate-dependent enzyme [Bacteroidales bacterium]
MLNGHGDDAFRYSGIRHNFSSNIFSHADLGGLKRFLASRLDVIGVYPEPEPRALARLIAECAGVSEASVLVTSGATEAIYMIAGMAGSSPAVICQPTFSEYADACRMAGVQVHSVSFPFPDHILSSEPALGSVTALPPFSSSSPESAVWLCNPNNPTGTVLPRNQVRAIAANARLLILDQSYGDYTAEPLLTPAEAVAAGNILQLHSLTKTYCIPGLRLGFVIGAPALIASLRQHLRPWSVNALALEAAGWLMARQSPLPERDAYLAETQRLREGLLALDGLSVVPTQTNFMLCRLKAGYGLTSAQLKERLATCYGILIRDASNFEGLTPYHFRVAAQTREE